MSISNRIKLHNRQEEEEEEERERERERKKEVGGGGVFRLLGWYAQRSHNFKFEEEQEFPKYAHSLTFHSK